MFFHSKRSDSTKNFSSSMKLDVRLEQIRSCVVLKDAIAKNFVANEQHSFTSVFTFSVVVVDLPTDRILTFLFPAETDVLVPVFSQSTDVVVVNFVVVLKFPIVGTKTGVIAILTHNVRMFSISPEKQSNSAGLPKKQLMPIFFIVFM